MPRAYRIFTDRARFPHLRLTGIHLHLGSPIYSTSPFQGALRKVGRFVLDVRGLGVKLSTLNLGGGYCISYDGRPVIQPADYAAVILPAVRKLGMNLIIEPGRYIAGNSGILLTRVIYVKEGWLGRKFVIVDAAMNDLIRPALYEAYHRIWPAFQAPGHGASKPALERVDIVGPICETSDCFARDRDLPHVSSGELLAVFSAGAYGMSMSSNYNSRPRPAETLVAGGKARLIRKRESYRDLVRGE
jgi:diaminopimelate decarboxylase